MENAFSELNQSATEPMPTDIQRIHSVQRYPV